MSTDQTPEEIGYKPAGPTFAIPPATPEAACRACRATIFWIVTGLGKRMPVNPDGTSHFATCPNAADFRKPKPTPAPKLTSEHLAVLRAYERGGTPDLGRTRFRIAADECTRWGLIHSTKIALTPAGVDALAKARGR